MYINAFQLIVSSLACSAALPVLFKKQPLMAAVISSLFPALAVVSLISAYGDVRKGRTFFESVSFFPALDINFSFRIDGLSLFFALLIAGMGSLVACHALGYISDCGKKGRFFGFFFLFFTSMVGVVLSANLISMFVFWELTSLSSFFLIGFDHTRDEARKSAWAALLVTSGGGLALLAGFILLGEAGGSYEFADLLSRSSEIRAHHYFRPAVALILLGAFTKSAQWPFHFWLPLAMEAPAPVSAYLHSATMVKAGVYLVARFTPVLGGTPEWSVPLVVVGVMTVLTGAWFALLKTDAKQALAYSTLAVLGGLVMLLGIGSAAAINAMVIYLAAHACYKGALFLVVGNIDHEVGERSLKKLGGLRKSMPFSCIAGCLAAVSMAGVPPSMGFVGKEAVLDAARMFDLSLAAPLISAVIILGSSAVAIAVLTGFKPFLARGEIDPAKAHEAPALMYVPPLLLGVLGLTVTLLPDSAEFFLLRPAAAAILSGDSALQVKVWHGINWSFGFSLASVLLGLVVFRSIRMFWSIADRNFGLTGPLEVYNHGLNGLFHFARRLTDLIQSGSLQQYVRIVLCSMLLLVIISFVKNDSGITYIKPTASFHEWTVAILITSAWFAMIFMKRMLALIAALGVTGYGVALSFMLYGGTDLALTQFAVETLGVILFVLVLYRLPDVSSYSRSGARMFDFLLAAATGTLAVTMMMSAAAISDLSVLARYFIENALPAAMGRNVVNTILVDFRALDTLGEISVLCIAALGIHALLKLKRESGITAPDTDVSGGQYPSLILLTASRLLLPLLLLLSFFLLIRGHNMPGGGFVGGLTAAVAFTLHMIGNGVPATRRILRLHPETIIGAGLAVAGLSSIFSLATGLPFMTAFWMDRKVMFLGKLGTPLLFDAGVYLVVLGVVLLVFLSLAEES